MRRSSPFLRSYTPHLLVGVSFLLVIALIAINLDRGISTDSARDRVIRECIALAHALDRVEQPWQPVIDSWSRDLDAEIAVFDSSGMRLVIDTDPSSPSAQAAAQIAPEILEALRTGTGSSVRPTHNEGRDVLFVAATIPKSAGVVRIASPTLDAVAPPRYINVVLVILLLTAVMAAVLLFVRASTKAHRSLSVLSATASRLSAGDWNARVPVDPYSEADGFSEVGYAFNQMADEVQLRYDKSHRERDQLHTVLANMSDGVLAVDGHGIVRLVNSAFLGYFRPVFESPIGHSHTVAFRDRGLNTIVQQLLDSASESTLELSVTEPMYRVLVLRSAAIPGSDDSAVRGVIVARDVTARNRVEQMRRDFVANVSHELRTPLTAILGYLEAMKDIAPPQGKHSMFLDTITRNAVRMNRIVADLLELSRIEAPDFKPQVSEFSLSGVFEEVANSLRGALDHKSQTLAIMVGSGAGKTVSDKDALYRIVFNLTDNAHKYTPEGGRISIETRLDGDSLVISVIDDGIGVPEVDRQRLFERFFRVDRARSRESGGTGLGLAIVKHLTGALGGTVEYESNQPRGSRFVVTLPQMGGRDL